MRRSPAGSDSTVTHNNTKYASRPRSLSLSTLLFLSPLLFAALVLQPFSPMAHPYAPLYLPNASVAEEIAEEAARRTTTSAEEAPTSAEETDANAVSCSDFFSAAFFSAFSFASSQTARDARSSVFSPTSSERLRERLLLRLELLLLLANSSSFFALAAVRSLIDAFTPRPCQ